MRVSRIQRRELAREVITGPFGLVPLPRSRLTGHRRCTAAPSSPLEPGARIDLVEALEARKQLRVPGPQFDRFLEKALCTICEHLGRILRSWRVEQCRAPIGEILPQAVKLAPQH